MLPFSLLRALLLLPEIGKTKARRSCVGHYTRSWNAALSIIKSYDAKVTERALDYKTRRSDVFNCLRPWVCNPS